MRKVVVAAALCMPAVATSAAGMSVRSRDFQGGGRVPMADVLNRFGCAGDNRSPAVAWSGEPAGTRSFAITLFDPDAPNGRGWWHWAVFDIPATVHSLRENAGAPDAATLPTGALQGRNDFGFEGYGGPCPPAGARPHRYILTVYALKLAELQIESGSSDADLSGLLRSATLAEAQTIGRYGRR